MSFIQVKHNSLDFDLKSVFENGRFYVVPGGFKYPSVTTILSDYNKEGLDKWRSRVGEEEATRISKRAANRGTIFHNICEQYFKNNLSKSKMVFMTPFEKQLFLPFKKEVDKHLNNIRCLEQSLFTHKLKVAGRVDCVADWDGELAIVDLKTSDKLKKESYITSYFIQCTLYALMFEEITRIPVNRIVVVIAVENENFPQIFVKDKREFMQETLRVVKKYHNSIKK